MTKCVHDKENCYECCKYCHIPFQVWQIDEDSFEIECPNCGYNVG